MYKHTPIKDPGRIAALLHVVEKIATVAPQQTHLLGAAMSEINAANEEHKQDGLANAKAQAANEEYKQHEAQVLEQAKAARARLDAEEDAKRQHPLDQKVVTEADKIEAERKKREEAVAKAQAPQGSATGLTSPDPSGPKVNPQTDRPLVVPSDNRPDVPNHNSPSRVDTPVFPRKIDDNGGGPV
jgi:hypothetical protein